MYLNTNKKYLTFMDSLSDKILEITKFTLIQFNR